MAPRQEFRPVIDQNTWDRVQLARSGYSRRHPGRPTKRRPYALMLCCAACGRHLIGQSGRYATTSPARTDSVPPGVRRESFGTRPTIAIKV